MSLYCFNIAAAPPLLAFIEPHSTALLLAVLGALIAMSALFSRGADKLGVPVVLLFLALGMLGGSEGLGQVWFENYAMAARLGTVALVLILFDGGLNTQVASIREAMIPATVLATVGVALTAGAIACLARLLGVGWRDAVLLGAVVSSTDAAATFAVLRGAGLSLRPGVARLIELESCINDPMAVILTLAMIRVLDPSLPAPASIYTVLFSVPVQLVLGTAVGLIVGFFSSAVLRRIRLATVGLYPALTLSAGMISFGAATLVQGSGFLAVYVTAVVIGNSPHLPYRAGLARVHDSLAWLSQVGMFLMLGLLVYPSRLLGVAWQGLGIALLLALLARPLAVIVCLLPFARPARQIAYVAWVGLRGAVPIILATYPVLARLPGAQRVFDLVFFIVVVSTLVPGATIRFVTRRLGLDEPQTPNPAAVLEINSSLPLDGELASFFITPNLVVCGATLAELDFPRGTAVVMLVRGEQLLAARGDTRLEAGDHVYVFLKRHDRPLIELLFGGQEQT